MLSLLLVIAVPLLRLRARWELHTRLGCNTAPSYGLQRLLSVQADAISADALGLERPAGAEPAPAAGG